MTKVIRCFLFHLRSSGSCDSTAPGPSLYTGLSSRSHSLASRSHSVHSLLNIEIPPPPKAPRTDTKTKGSKHKRSDPPAPLVSIRDSGESLRRSRSQDRLDTEEWEPGLARARPLMPPYSDLRSVSAEHQPHQPGEAGSGLYRTISRATLVDQDTGNVYQVHRQQYIQHKYGIRPSDP